MAICNTVGGSFTGSDVNLQNQVWLLRALIGDISTAKCGNEEASIDTKLLAVESNHNLLPNSETELEKNTRQRAKSSILKADRWLRYKVRGESKKASEQFNDAELDLSGEIELKIEIESEDDTLTEVWTAVKKYEWLCEDFVAEFTEFFPTHQMRLNRIRKPK
ncbi:hypothetical protein MMC14_010058 [Varicellaria rhodocarpa]|nr:hypothetical protein [Varicellaria rhodocarpa]